MKFKLGSLTFTIEQTIPEIGVVYHHKERDPRDIVDYVIPQRVEGNIVHYIKFYKAGSEMDDAWDRCPIIEFNRWYRKGV